MTSTQPIPASLRLFIALPVPAQVRASLSAALDAALPDDGHLRRARPEGWHVTLAFLGETPAARLPDVVGVVTTVLARRPPPDQVRLATPGCFGGHTLWIGVDDRPLGSLVRLGADLQSALCETDLPVARRELVPHITVARARHGGRVVPSDVRALEPIPPTSWHPDGVEIWQTQLGNGPARYTSAGSVPRADTGHRNESGDSSTAT